MKGYDAWKLSGPPEGREVASAENMVGKVVYHEGAEGTIGSYYTEPDDEYPQTDLVVFELWFPGARIEVPESSIEEWFDVDN
jgi:hypothetical protein